MQYDIYENTWDFVKAVLIQPTDHNDGTWHNWTDTRSVKAFQSIKSHITLQFDTLRQLHIDQLEALEQRTNNRIQSFQMHLTLCFALFVFQAVYAIAFRYLRSREQVAPPSYPLTDSKSN
jgi:queuine/archaeosine tRNA-ribosyltransferase